MGFRFVVGKTQYDFYITPCIHIYSRYVDSTIIDLCWLNRFIGIELEM